VDPGIDFNVPGDENASAANRLTGISEIKMCTAHDHHRVKTPAWGVSTAFRPVAELQRIDKWMIGMDLNPGAQIVASPRNSSAESALGPQTRGSSTELSTGSVGNFT
jgi:hypothetical protein